MAPGARTGRPAITSVLEWISAATGLLLAIAILGIIGWQALRSGGASPPALEASVIAVERAGSGYAVEVEVRNASDVTAAGVLLQGQLRTGAVAVETSEASVDYVPAQSRRKAGLVFSRDPRSFDLVVRPIGYQYP